MFRAVVFSLVMAGCALNGAMGEEPKSPSPFDEAIDFVEKHLIGKALLHHETVKIDRGRMETDFERRAMYINLVRTPDLAMFDWVAIIRQKLWDLDENGKRVSEEPRIENRVVVVRYSFHKSEVTGEALGTSEAITNSVGKSWGYASNIRLRVVDGKLRLEMPARPFYSDGFAKGGGYKPIQSEQVVTFSVVDGKLTSETVGTTYDVNPETMERLSVSSQYRMVDVEVPSFF